MKFRSPLLLATTLAGMLVGLPGCDVSDEDPDDLPALALERAELAGISALAPGVIGLQSSGVPNPMNTVDGDLTTSTTVDSVVGSCPLHNNGPFIKLLNGQCIGPGTTYFHGWEMVTFQLGNGGAVDAVDLALTHGRAGLSQNSATTLVYASWDGRTFSYVGAYTATSTMATRTIRVVPPSRPATSLTVVLGKSTATPAPPSGPTLRWHELSAASKYVAAPGNLVARTTSASSIDLTWTDTSTGEIDFEIQMLEAGIWRSLGADPGGANQTAEPITGLAGSTTYSFRVRARSATSSSPFSNVATATTLTGPPGQLDLINNSQVDLLAVSLNGVRRNPDQIAGNRATFNLSPGAYGIGVAMGFGPNTGLAAGARICDWIGQATVVSGQTVTRVVQALTAGQVLTHCGTFIDYDGNYVDLSGFHTVRIRIHAGNSFQWWHDGREQPGGTITNNLFLPPNLSFQLSTGDIIDIGWPFGSFTLEVNGAPVLMLRASGW